ncbi:metallophosphoesterase family protein [Bauldia sp.]|uniref:metallophosphoesterase family protein n=1 Tax=Bauldia sp. TaxID=2575872 RepID=UPI003BAC8FA1
MTAFTLAHLSDPHLGPLPAVRWRELVSKRILGYVNWHRRRVGSLGRRNLDALVADIKAEPPNHIAVSGDLINLGLKAESDAARRWLDRLGDPEDVTVVPGNHDAYIPGAARMVGHGWQPFMRGDNQPAGPTRFPFVRRRGPVAIIGVSTAVATAPFMATGRIRPSQSTRLAHLLAELGEEDRFRVVVLHHPPAIGSTKWHRRLIGAGVFRQAIKKSGAELILHGHNHRTAVDNVAGPTGPVPVVGATSASLHPRDGLPGGSYLRFRIASTRDGFICDMTEHARRQDDGPVEVLSERRLIGRGAS